MPGTVEALALELARVLEPLKARLSTPEGAVGLFQELALPLPTAARDALQTAPEAGQIVAALAGVGPDVVALEAAVGAGDPAAIASALDALVPEIAGTVTAVRALAGRVRAAFGDLGVLPQEIRDLVAALPERLVAWLIVTYLEGSRPRIARALKLVGVVESDRTPAHGTHPAFTRRELRLDRIGALLVDPVAAFRDLYGWGDPGRELDAKLVLSRLRDFLVAIGLPAVLDPFTAELRALLFGLRPAPGGPPTSLDLTVALGGLTGIDLELTKPGATVEGRLSGTGSLELGTGIRIHPPASLEPLSPTGSVDGEAVLSASGSAPAGTSLLLFGQVDGTRLVARAARAAVGASFAAGPGGLRADLVIEAKLEAGQLVVAFGGADSFLASLLPRAAALDLDLGLRWTALGGLTFDGSAELAVTVPLGLVLGPLRLDLLDLSLRPQPGTPPSLVGEATLTGALDLGVLGVVVEGFGASAELLLRGGSSSGSAPAGALDLGPVAVSFRFRPPSGLGVVVNAPGVSGGGFLAFDEASGRYTGVLDLVAGEVSIVGIGLLDTRLPGGRPGYSLLVFLAAGFPGIQLGLGISLTGVGGLLALNRRLDLDTLRARFSAGTAGRLLQLDDPVAEAPTILPELDAVFPVAEGMTVVGPTVQLTWLGLVTLDLGIFFELPGPSAIVLLGTARVVIAHPAGGRGLLQLRVDILGTLDPAAETLAIDGLLVDSTLLDVFTLTGGALLRVSWGAQPYLVLSVGGFHPGFDPAPLVPPATLSRITMTRGHPGDAFYLRLEGYFAVTSNSLQLGSRVEVRARVGDVAAHGFLSFDVLLRLQPFFFTFDFTAGVEVTAFGVTIAGVRLSGTLSGPGPVTFTGEACLEILFFDICFKVDARLGRPAAPQATPVPSALDAIAAELRDPANLHAVGASRFVTLTKPVPAPALTLLPPADTLVWRQSLAPLGVLLERVQGAPVARPETVTVASAEASGEERDWFAPGAFADLSDAETLQRRAFERLQAGVRLGMGAPVASNPVSHQVGYAEHLVPSPDGAEPASRTDTAPAPAWVYDGLDRRTGIAAAPTRAPAITLVAEQWRLHDATGRPVTTTSETQAHQLARHLPGGVAVPAGDLVTLPSF